jgi:N6-adenosine-specific RNA methylase IME4
MTIGNIKELPVKEISDPTGAILALWVPSSLLQEGLDTMKAWGFKHKQTYIWVKNKKDPISLLRTHAVKFVKLALKLKSFSNKDYLDGLNAAFDMFNMNNLLAFGMGRLFRQTHEICLIGTNNNGIYKLLKNKSQRSISFGENLKHSAKPEHLQDSLEIMFPGTKMIELFARRSRAGWTCIGNEVCNGEDIRDSLKKLL